MQKITLFVEHVDDHYWGFVDDDTLLFQPNGHGDTQQEMMEDVKGVIKDYLAHEGKNDEYWRKVNVDKLEFELKEYSGE